MRRELRSKNYRMWSINFELFSFHRNVSWSHWISSRSNFGHSWAHASRIWSIWTRVLIFLNQPWGVPMTRILDESDPMKTHSTPSHVNHRQWGAVKSHFLFFSCFGWIIAECSPSLKGDESFFAFAHADWPKIFHVFDDTRPELFGHFGVACVGHASQLSSVPFEEIQDHFEV